MTRIQWQYELDAIAQSHPCFWARFAHPRIVVLPTCLNRGYGAWTYLRWIVLTQKQCDCPAHVRRYVLGHEFGHIYGRHVGMQWLWLLAGFLYGVGLFSPALLLLAICIKSVLFYGIVNKRLGTNRELYADAIAAQLFGAKSALRAARWMTRATGEQNSEQRALRLLRLEAIAH